MSIVDDIISYIPITWRGVKIYLLALLGVAIIIVVSVFLIVRQREANYRRLVKEGKIYIPQNGGNTIDIDIFTLPPRGGLILKKLYPDREFKDRWSKEEVQKYREKIGETSFEELNVESLRILREEVEDAP